MEKKGKEVKISQSGFVTKNAGKMKEYYKLGRIVGTGAFGEVRICLHKETNTQRAMKILSKTKMDEEDLELLENEVNILKELDHPNLIKMFEFFEDQKRLIIITEYCKGGELFDEIIARNKFREGDAAFLMKQILSVVNYIHTKGIAHRDIKPENILLEESKDFATIKLVDFGTAIHTNPDKPLNETLGTPYYIAPEVLMGSYDERCDVWSCGVMLYIFLTGDAPFSGETQTIIQEKIMKGTFSVEKLERRRLSAPCIDFVKKLLTYEYTDRISAREALEHPWLTSKAASSVDEVEAKEALSHLKVFRAEEKLKQATYAYIASQLLSKSEKEQLGAIFKALDLNGDGRLERSEITEGYEKFFGRQISPEEVEAMFESVDIDKSGFIDYSEFVIASMNEKNILSNERLKAAFRMMDRDGSGSVSAEEIKTILSFGGRTMSSEVIESVLKQVDANCDGEISLEEFLKMMQTGIDNAKN